MTWTKKHDEFALTCNFSESMSLICRYLLRRGKLSEPTEVELDLKKCNCWIGKYRVKGEYHRKTLATAISNLDDRSNGMFTIIKSYSPWVHKVLVRPLSFVERIQSAKRACTSQLSDVKPMFDKERKKAVALQQQQNISKIDLLFNQVGIKFTTDALIKLWRMSGKSLANISQAVELLLHRHSIGTTKISNPQGFLVNCLKYGWHNDFNPYYQNELPVFGCGSDIQEFVRGILSQPKSERDIGECHRNQLRYQT